jgi:hypothetical protein
VVQTAPNEVVIQRRLATQPGSNVDATGSN